MKKTARVALLCLLAVSWGCGTNPDRADPAETSEASSVKDVISTLYACLSFPAGGGPDLDRYASLFAPEARSVRVNKDDSIDRFTLDGFVAAYKARIAKGEITSLRESEIAAKIQVFGRLAHVFSSYTKLVNTLDPKAAVRGVNGFQLIKQGEAWKICAVIWMDERATMVIPAEYLD